MAQPQLSKRDRFVKYAPKRTQTAIKAIERLGNCFNPGSYEFSSAERERSVKGLLDAIAAQETRFAKKKDAPPTLDILDKV